MMFTWDSEKSDKNFRERGFDFAFATRIFERPTLEREDDREDYGERRLVVVGLAAGFHLTVVYTDREVGQGETVRRIISAGRSNRRERQAYRRRIKG